MNKVILIGGAPTSGKSYLARILAQDLNLPWISTDTIRGQMRKIVRKEDYPALFLHEEASADVAVEYLTHNSAEEIVSHQNRESEEVWKGVAALIETDYVWGKYIIEGVAILPEFVAKLNQKNQDVQAIFLVDTDEQRIRGSVYTRGLWDDADKYPDSVKDREIAWVLAFNQWLVSECKKYDLPVVYIGDRNSYIDQIKSLVN